MAGGAGESTAAGRAGLRQRARPPTLRAAPAGERGTAELGGGLGRGRPLDAGLRHGRVLGHRAGPGALRLPTGRGRRSGTAAGVGSSRRLGPRAWSHRAFRGRRACQRGVSSPSPRRSVPMDFLSRPTPHGPDRPTGPPDGPFDRRDRTPARRGGTAGERGAPESRERPSRPRILRDRLRQRRCVLRRPAAGAAGRTAGPDGRPPEGGVLPWPGVSRRPSVVHGRQGAVARRADRPVLDGASVSPSGPRADLASALRQRRRARLLRTRALLVRRHPGHHRAQAEPRGDPGQRGSPAGGG